MGNGPDQLMEPQSDWLLDCSLDQRSEQWSDRVMVPHSVWALTLVAAVMDVESDQLMDRLLDWSLDQCLEQWSDRVMVLHSADSLALWSELSSVAMRWSHRV